MTFSIAKETTIPPSNARERVNPDASAASGRRWMNASPNRVPAEKLTMNRRNFLSPFSFSVSVRMPIKDIRLTAKTLVRVKSATLGIQQTKWNILYKTIASKYVSSYCVKDKIKPGTCRFLSTLHCIPWLSRAVPFALQEHSHHSRPTSSMQLSAKPFHKRT